MFENFTKSITKTSGADIVTFATLTEVVSAVLRRFPADRVEWMTAVGFMGGVLATLLLVCVDKAFLGG